MNIVNIDTEIIIDPKHERVLKSLGNLQTYKDIPSIDIQRKRVREADIIITYNLQTELMITASHLKMICVSATGYDRVDIAVAKKRNIVVSNCPGFSTEGVAEHTIGLMLSAIRLSSLAQTELRMGTWKSTRYKGFNLNGKTLGVIGFGRIGKRVAEIAQKGLHMKIISINSKDSRKDLEILLKKSDIISVNAPLNNQTRGLISDNEFQLMKKGVVLVNTGRGAIIDEKALVANLLSGKIFAAGLDTFTHEPIEKNNPLLQIPNVTLTPHIAWNTSETEYRLSKMVVDNVRNFIHGKPINVVS